MAQGQSITAAGQPAQLDVRTAGDRSIRVTLRPISFVGNFPDNPAIFRRADPASALSLREINRPGRKRVAGLAVEVRPQPLTLIVRSAGGILVQGLSSEGGNLSFKLDDQPVLGMGEGEPRPALGSSERQGWDCSWRLPGCTSTCATRTRRVPAVEAHRGQQRPADRAKSAAGSRERIFPMKAIVSGLYDFFLFDAHEPAAALPPKWVLGYMQSHRTLEDETCSSGSSTRSARSASRGRGHVRRNEHRAQDRQD